jgi:hypothetical protein
MIKRKRIEIFLDAVILLTGLLLLITIISGGIQLNIGDKIIGLRSFRNPLIIFLIFFSFRTFRYGKPFSPLPTILQGATGIWVIISSIVGLIVIYLVSTNILASSTSKQELVINQENAKEFSPESSFNIHKGKIGLKSNGQYLLEFWFPAGNKTVDFSKIRFRFDRSIGTRNLTNLHVIYENSDGDVIKGVSKVRIVRGVFVYDLPLVDKDFDTFHVIIKSNLESVDSEIAEISLLSPDASDYKYYTSILAIIIAFFLISPGLLIVSILSNQRRSVTVLLYSLFAASLCYYLVLYLILELSFLLEFSKPGNILIYGLLLSITCLVYINYRLDRFDTLNHYLASTRVPIFIFIVTLLLLTAYISFDTPYPFQNLGWQSISGPKTFDVFHAHDNYFQYANGRVIAENLPFSAEYGNRRLLYMPEDREILPGVIYAVFRSIYSAVNTYIGNSYMAFIIFGVAMNLMVIFPIIALARRYVVVKQEMFLIALIFGNAIFIVQPSITWFKFCGGALFLSAILILLRDRENIRSWLLAGLMFGLAANMHAAVSIGIPLYFLWFFYHKGRETNYHPARWLFGPSMLVGMFVLVNLPWKLIKKHFLQDSIDLFTTFFFAGHKVNESLLDSAAFFFNKIPLDEQITFRMGKLLQSFRLEEVFKLPEVFVEFGFEKFLLQWTQYEVGYTVFLYYPLALLLMIFFILNNTPLQSSIKGAMSTGFSGKGRNNELKALILLGIATQLAFVIAAFSFNHQPDVSWSQPYGVTILIYLSMMLILLQNRLFAGLLTVYVLFSYTRLYLSYQVLPILW